MKILVVDDHAVVRKGLVQILDEAPFTAKVDEASRGEDVLDMVRNTPFDVIILDLHLPGMSGLQVLEQLRHVHPDIPVIILSMHDEEEYGVRVLRAGAAGFVAKGTDPDVILDAVRRVAEGKRYISPGLAEHLLVALDTDTHVAPHEALSDREFEVFRRLADGQTVTVIGDELHLSVKTISTYRSRILEKLGMDSNADLVKYALRHGIVV